MEVIPQERNKIEPAPIPSLVYSPHPLLSAAGRRIEFTPFAPGESIRGFIDRLDIQLGSQPVVLFLNDEVIPLEEWALTVPAPGDLITIRARVHGGDGGSDVTRVVLFIAVAVAAAYTGGLAAANYGAFAGYLAQAAVIIGGALLINHFRPLPRGVLADGRTTSESPTYSLAGGSNRARPYEPLPLVMGKHRVFPDYGARPYTEFIGSDQYLYQVFNFGLADAELSDFRIGTTPLASFQGVTLEVSGDDGKLNLFPGNVDTQGGGALSAAVSWVTRNSSPDATQLSVEVTGNLFYTGDAGLEPRSAAIEIEYRAVGAASWQTFALGTAIVGYHTHYWAAGHTEWYTIPPFFVWASRYVVVNYGSNTFADHFDGEPYDAVNKWFWTPYTNIFGLGLQFGIPAGSKAPPREIYGSVPQITITSASRNPLRRTWSRQVARGQYEVRVRRVTADETDPRAVSDLVWSQLRTYQPDDADYTGQLRVGLRIKASGQLQGTVDRLSAIVTSFVQVIDDTAGIQIDTGTAQGGSANTITLRAGASAVDDEYNGLTVRLDDARREVILDYDGTSKVATMAADWADIGTFGVPDSSTDYDVIDPQWPVQATSNPAWHILNFARGKTINGRRVYGGGLPDARIDIQSLIDFGAWCDQQGLTFNGVFDQAESVREMLDTIARVGRGSTSWATGKLGVVWDAPSLPVSAVFGMANIKRNTFEVNYVTEKLADEIVMTFINPALDWQQDTVRALVPGVTNPQSEVTINLFGCTDKDMAGRDANLLAAQQVYRRRMISWESDIEGMVANRGDVVALSHDLTQWGYSGRLVAGTATQLTLDREVPFTPGLAHYIGIVFPNGFYQIVDVVFQVGPAAVIDLVNPLPSVDDQANALFAPDLDPTHPPMDYKWMFEPSLTPGKRLKIFSVAPLSEYHVRIAAFEDSDDFYAYENAGYIYLSPNAGVTDLPTLSNVQATETLLRVGSGFAVRLTIAFDTSGAYSAALVRVGIDGAPLEDAGGTTGRRVELTLPDTGTASIELTAFDAKGRWTDGGRVSIEHVIIGKSAPPPDVLEFAIEGNRLTWSSVFAVDLRGYEIRFHYGSRISFDDAQPLHTGVLTESPYDMLTRPGGPVTFMINAVDTTDHYSDNPAVIITDLGDVIVANVVQEFDLKALAWPGTISGGVIDGNGDIAATDTILFYGVDENATLYGLNSELFYPAVVYETLVYETDEIALTEATAGSTLTMPYTIAGNAVQILWRRVGPNAFYADLDSEVFYDVDAGADFYDPPPAYSSWPGSVSPLRELVQWKVQIGQGGTQGLISKLTPTLDMPDIVERFDDLVIASGGSRLPITKTYRAIKNISLTLQDDGGSANNAKVFDKNVTLGPLVQCFDGATPSAGLIDATIQGY